MTLYAFYCRDGENGAVLREKFLAQHLAHVESAIDKIAVAGPLKQGDDTVGSLLVVKAENEENARTILEADPYFDAGVWQSITVDKFLGVAGDWVGGATWK
ncbi:MAG: YciI family protein [Marinomonas sp.]